MDNTLRRALDMIGNETPLVRNCGSLCGAACCQDDGDGTNGMLLLPGEESLCASIASSKLISDSSLFPGGLRFVCNGTCERELRPFSCRIFPLVPRIRNGKITVEPDPRAWAVCPLMQYGKDGLRGSFVSGVQAACELLYEDAVYSPWFEGLEKVLSEYDLLRRDGL